MNASAFGLPVPHHPVFCFLSWEHPSSAASIRLSHFIVSLRRFPPRERFKTLFLIEFVIIYCIIIYLTIPCCKTF